ncbi:MULTISPECIES: amidohydrolase family protein [Nonomuraea]|uniref:Amidohydrolase family protein n=1 Tax=Nonomuraea ferruginea TaxID=46174 RepID=A0ABT4SVM3_9ACTN|nr:amidohydrolase family protein [Nonomuraea ferruginea]MDA0641227.1 amidohydrolase family protein [Nonomuraea ferruginea]
MASELTVLSGLHRTIEELPLVDQHAHGVTGRDLSRAAFEELITEAHGPAPDWMTPFDSQLGHAILRHCAPVLGLDAFISPEEYLARRARLGVVAVNRLLLGAAGAGHYLIETGYRADEVVGPSGMAELAAVPVDEVVRLEAVAEQVAASGVSAAGFAGRFAEALGERIRTARALKSIVAYRHGLDLDPDPPSPAEVTEAAGRWLAAGGRLADPVLLRHLIWTALETGLPLQFHTGIGDPDLDLRRADPLLLRGLIERTQPAGVPLVLLHCYPFHRHAGYLAHAYPHVFFDLGLAVHHTGAGSAAVVAESLEIAPFAKIMFSSDGWGPAELHFLGAELWRRAMTRVLGGFVTDGEWSAGQAVRVATMIGATNARRLYRLGGAA